MAFTAEEQKLYDFARAALPRFLFAVVRAEEEFGAFVKIFDDVRQVIENYSSEAFILTATGGTPDFLNQHAKDRGTSRQLGESDVDLRERLRNVEDVVTRPLLLSQAQTILTGASINGTAVMNELRRDKAFFRTAADDSGTGGTFSGTPPNMEFTPTAGFAGLPFRSIEELVSHKMVFSGSLSSGNDGTFIITGLSGDAVQYTNASGVVEADVGVSWTDQKFDSQDNSLAGFQDAYFSRGDRMSSQGSSILVILPFGCTSATLASVNEMLRQKKGAGVLQITECMNGLDYPQTAAALNTALGSPTALADNIVHLVQTSDPQLDLVGSSDLSSAGNPGLGIDSESLGSKCTRYTDGTPTRSFAATSSDYTATTGSFGILGVFSSPEEPSANRTLLSKRSSGGGAGYELYLTPAGQLVFEVEDAGATVNTATVPFVAGPSFCDGQLHIFYALRDATSGFVRLATTLGSNVTPETVVDVSNSELFRIGNGVLTSFGGDFAYLAYFTGADAEVILDPEISALYSSMLLATLQ